ncbi:MAG: dhbF [Anaerocolumna sp.]|jgi:amino acid adenylation domain-containing protein|nr:dhbF [Anaerocolumna sp.]
MNRLNNIDICGNIIFENQEISSEEIRNQMIRLGSKFGNYKKIAIAIDRSPGFLIAIMTCLKYGIIFLPINLNQPVSRIQYIISDSNVDSVFTSKKYLDVFQKNNIILEEEEFSPEYAEYDMETSHEIAYILYTSGTTGTPKGVEVTMEGLMNFIDGISEVIDFSPGKRIACLAEVSFDIFMLESVAALLKGLTIVLANNEERKNPRLLAKLIDKNKVDMVQMTPSGMQLLLYSKNIECLANIKDIMIGGESFPLNLLKILQKETTAKIYNMYGPTETTIWSAISDLTHKDKVDIGKPIKDTEIYILDHEFQIIDNGQAGEICITGKGLAKGYLGRDDLTAQSFICLPQKPNKRAYRTGDLGRYLPNGNIEYIGRLDNQVKIRGHRIEPEEIEAHINQFEGISQSIVISNEAGQSNITLIALFVSDNDINPSQLTEYLEERIPAYMIPARFSRVNGFTYTDNGKIDRKKTYENMEFKTESIEDEVQPEMLSNLSEIQRKAYEIIELKLYERLFDDIAVDNEVKGIDSITFIIIVVALEEEFDIEFEEEKLIIESFTTIRSILEYTEAKINLLL